MRTCRMALLLLTLTAAVAAGETAAPEPLAVAGTNEAATALRFSNNKVRLLAAGPDALAARLDIIAQASSSIDLQYYIYHNDRSGRLLTEALLRAADRGVKVRALLDDIHGNSDDFIEALNHHPGIEIRHFNPFRFRNLRLLETILAFGRVDRRMHNKQLTVDGRFSIVGGRNIGDEYFGTSDESAFADLDVLVAGPVVKDLVDVFDEYWISPRSKHLSAKHEDINDKDLLALRAQLVEQLQSDAGPLRSALAASAYVQARKNGDITPQECQTAVLADRPEQKVDANASTNVGMRLGQYLRDANDDVFLMSAYFVPGKEGTAELTAVMRKNVKLLVLTNSLASTDVAAVHAGYSRYRRALLEAGADLREMKPLFDKKTNPQFSPGGSSHASLHTKAYVFDRRYIFVGSFNLDPRSATLNTEMGLLFDCPPLAAPLRQRMEQVLPQMAYRVYLDAEDDLRWDDVQGGSVSVHEKEPKAGFWRRSAVWWLKLLPIEGEL